MDIFYSDYYGVDIGEHLFPMDKYRLTREVLTIKGEFGVENFEEPEPVGEENILKFHAVEYMEKLKGPGLGPEEEEILEMPYSKELFESMKLHAGGTLGAARTALRDGVACNLGGGFHHAYPDHGEGLCLINDIGIAVQTLLDEGAVERVLVLDLDVHQGNGTAFFFRDDERVMTFSMHSVSIYPHVKETAGMNIGLHDGMGDTEYMDILRGFFYTLFDEFFPQLVVYIAGADVYANDLVGKLGLTIEGIKHRDEAVFWEAASRCVPIVSLAGGGYARSVEDVVAIHANTIRAADTAAVTFRRAKKVSCTKVDRAVTEG